MVSRKLVFVSATGVLVGSAVASRAFGYSGYIRNWDPGFRDVVWETKEPGAGRSSWLGDSFADVDVVVVDMHLDLFYGLLNLKRGCCNLGFSENGGMRAGYGGGEEGGDGAVARVAGGGGRMRVAVEEGGLRGGGEYFGI